MGSVAITLTSLGTCHGTLRDFVTQKSLLERALQIQETVFGPDHRMVAVTLMSLGNAYNDLENGEKARALLERALRIQEAVDGPEHNVVKVIRKNLVHVQRTVTTSDAT